MNRVKVALDVDGVLANFYLAMCIKFNKPYVSVNSWSNSWQEENFPKTFDDLEFWDTLPNINHPHAITFEFDCYITAIPEHLKDSRIKWLKKHGYPDKPVITAHDKATAMIENDITILIDDKFENINNVHKAGLYGIHYVPDYMRPIQEETHSPMFTIKHLSEANEIIQKINKYESI